MTRRKLITVIVATVTILLAVMFILAMQQEEGSEPFVDDSHPEATVLVAEINDVELGAAVEEELKAQGIVCYIEGSVVSGVFVAQSDAAKAKEVIRNSKRIDRGQIRIIEK